ncbi:MAG: energy-coupling factor ABC transporter permease [Anaerosomatales bacterium]|nr:energy-coupling factor ABC transporter permease [Anaerosomatales bacterium]
MTHIHIPDGVLPVWLWGGGWMLAILALLVADRASRRYETRRRLPLVGIVSALVIVAMSSEVVPIAYHMNLTVLAGALLGPALAVVSAFVVQVVLAALGHGGVTIIGLNTLMTAAEMCLGWALLQGGIRLFGLPRAGRVAAAATVLTLFVTTTLLVGIVALSGVTQATGRETGALDPQNLTFASPFSEGVVHVGLFSGGESHEQPPETGSGLGLKRFATVVYTLGSIGWVLEALVTAAIVSYLSRVRPSLLVQPRALAPVRPAPAEHHGGA